MREMRYVQYAVAVILAMSAAAMAKDAPDIVPWTVKPDAPLASTQPASQPASRPAVSSQIKPDLSLSHPCKSKCEFIVPNRPSAFVITLGTESNGGWDLWDLHAGLRLTGGNGRLEMDNLTLSPDGRYIAGTTGYGASIEVWDIKTKKVATKIDAAKARGKVLGFAGDDRIVVHGRFADTDVIRIYDIASGQMKVEFPGSDDLFHLSPGGAYVVFRNKYALKFFSTSTGKHCGSIDLEKDKSRNAGTAGLADMAFSQDGAELSLLYAGFGTSRLAVYDLATGTMKREAYFSEQVQNRELWTIQYVPGSNGWLLFGDTLIDRQSMAMLYTFPCGADVLLTRMTGPEQMFQALVVKNRLIFQIVSPPAGTIARAIAALRSGRKAEDGDLPPLKKVDLSLAPLVTLDGTGTTAWLVKPAALAPPTKPIATTLPVAAPPGAPPSVIQYGPPLTVLFTSRAANSVVIERAIESISSARSAMNPILQARLEFARIQRSQASRTGRYHRPATWVGRYDLATGNLQASCDTSGLLELEDVSPTGNTLIFRGGSDADRIDVMTADKDSYKTYAAFCPFTAAKKPVVDNAQNKNLQPDGRILTAALIDDTHVLAVSWAGAISLWEIPSCKALWQSHLAPTGFFEVAVSPDRKLAAAGIKDGILVFDTISGKALGSLPGNRAAQPGGALAFSADGRQLGAIVRPLGSMRLMVFDLSTGFTTADVPLPMNETLMNIPATGGLQFVSPGYVLLGDLLISLEKKAIICRYLTQPEATRAWSGRFGSMIPIEGAWLLVDDEARLPAILLHPCLPDKPAIDATASIDSKDVYAWTPGMKVSLNVTVLGDDAFRKKEIARWTEELKKTGIEVVDGAPNVLTASTFVVSGTPVSRRFISMETGNNCDVSITPRGIGWRISLAVAGQEVWKNENTTPPQNVNLGMMDLEVKRGETVQQVVDRQFPPPAQGSQVLLPPTYIFKDRKIEVLKIGPRADSPQTMPNNTKPPTPVRPGK